VKIDEVDDVSLQQPVDAVGERATENQPQHQLAVPGGAEPMSRDQDVDRDRDRNREVQPLELGKHTEGGASILHVVDAHKCARPELALQG